MSDSLKKGLNVPSFNFTNGALPEAIVFDKLYESVRSGFNLLNNLLGPLVRKGTSIESKDYITSTSTYYSKMNSTNRSTLLATASNSITNTFNLARIIGAHSLLNIRYIPGSYHLKETQIAGWPLKSDTLEQQLPFPPGRATGSISYTLVANGVEFSRKTSKEILYSSTGPSYYVDVASATLYSNCYFVNGESLKYDLYIPNTESYIGAGYNCIPDLSILSLTLETRNSLVDEISYDYGCLKIQYISSTNDTALWKMRLPEVISVKESLLGYAGGAGAQKVAAGFEPVGKTISGIKRYVLPDVSINGGNDVFVGSTLQDNITLLFDSRTGESYPITLIRTGNEIIYNFTTPASLKDVLRDDSNNLISASTSNYNSRDFFLFTVATSLTGSIAQNAINFSQHDHDGINSKKLSHKDLVHTHLDMPAIPFQDRLAGESGGLNFLGFPRFFIGSEIPNDVHPQYLSRLGYKFGGSQGFYDKNSAYDSSLNKNMFFGDFVFFPIESVPRPYQYTTGTTTSTNGIRQEKISWGLNLDVSNYSQLRSHSFIFGNPDINTEANYSYYNATPVTVSGNGVGLQLNIKIPTNQLTIYDDYEASDFLNSITTGGTGYLTNDVIKVLGTSIGGTSPYNDLTFKVLNQVTGTVVALSLHPTLNANKTGPFQNKSYPNINGAVKLYYEPYSFITPNKFDQLGGLSALSRHGFIPGDRTGAINLANVDSSNIGGLNIGWGNLFFGHREDIFNGRLTNADVDFNTEASAYWRAGEFNILTTANSKAGTNTNSLSKTGYQYRDGFAVKAIKGSNIWLSVGGEGYSASTNPAQRGKTSTGIPGTFALEVSYPEGMNNNGYFGLKTLNSEDPRGNVIASGAGILSSPGPIVDSASQMFLAPWSSGYDNHRLAALWSSHHLNYHAPGAFGGVYGAEQDELGYGPGPILDIFSLAPDRQKSNSEISGRIGPGSDSHILGWVYGRPFLRGTYGVNFCLSGQLDGLHSDFKVGLLSAMSSESWGPESTILTAANGNQFIHREFRFWGKVSDSDSGDAFATTTGGNINLLYKFGQSFNRWGLNKIWDSTKSMDGKIERDNISELVSNTDPVPWQNSRRIALGSSKAEDYGSAIRQASFVEAFAGFRNDPYQPYTAEYVAPFKVKHRLGEIGAALGEDRPPDRVEKYLAEKTFTLSTTSINDFKYDDKDYIKCDPNRTVDMLIAPSIFVDQLIRGSEDMLLARSGDHINLFNSFPISLQSVKVDLEYFIGQKIITSGGRSTGDNDSPSKTQEALDAFGSGDSTAYQYIANTGMQIRALGAAEAGSEVATVPSAFSSGNAEDFQDAYRSLYGEDYKDLISGNVFMVEAYKTNCRNYDPIPGLDSNRVPILMKSNGYTPDVDPYKNNDPLFNRIPRYRGGVVGYDAAIGVAEVQSYSNTYFDSFPLFKSKYAGYMQNKMFCLLVNFGRKLDNFTNSPVPYRVFVADSAGNEPSDFYVTYTGAKGLVLDITLPVGPSGLYDDTPVSGNIFIDIASPGSGFEEGEWFNLPGSDLQGIDTINDVRVYVDSVGSSGEVLVVRTENRSTSLGRVSIVGGTIDEGIHRYLWVEFKGRLTLKTITALERDPSIFTDRLPY